MPIDIDPELPWGYWLNFVERPSGAVFIDEHGQEWATVRQAFWCGRLHMPLQNGEPPADQLELLHAVLADRARRPHTMISPVDLFGDDLLFCQHHMHWLCAEGLLVRQSPKESALKAELSREGVSALLMLAATRPQLVRQMRPTHFSVQQLFELGRRPLGGEKQRAEVEAAVDVIAGGFIRQTIGKPAVTLVHRGTGPIPVTLTSWVLAFQDVRARDTFYDWLIGYIDRWPEWVELGRENGGQKSLTEHLLQVLASELNNGANGDEGNDPGPWLALPHLS